MCTVAHLFPLDRWFADVLHVWKLTSLASLDFRITLVRLRRFSRRQRTALYLAAGGKCDACEAVLKNGWHADHVEPYCLGGLTDVLNGQALCPSCNLRKGSGGSMQKSCKLQMRDWQELCLEHFSNAEHPRYLLEATPGAGKTAGGLFLTRWLLSTGRVERVVVVVPSSHLKWQWARDAKAVGLELNPRWVSSEFLEDSDYDGIVVTYHQVASASEFLRIHCRNRPTVVLFDEIHHAGDQKSWGKSLVNAFEPAAYKVSLSGTPFRSDSAAIPFVTYENDRSVPDFRYTYADGLRDGVCRPVRFPQFEGSFEWLQGDAIVTATFADELAEEEARRRLYTALQPNAEWLPKVLEEGAQTLRTMRGNYRDAAGIVIAIDKNHANKIAELLTDITGKRPVVVHSDEEDPSNDIRKFRESTDEWIVSVKMVSEGVDIPRARVLVYATNVLTELFFRQAVGRVVRGTGDAVVLLPDDPTLTGYARAIKEERCHVLKAEDPAKPPRVPGEPDGEGGPSQAFVPLSATNASMSGVINHDGEEIGQDELLHTKLAMERAGVEGDPAKLALALKAIHVDQQRVDIDERPVHERKADLREQLEKRVRVAAVLYDRKKRDLQVQVNQYPGGSYVKTEHCTEELLTKRLAYVQGLIDSFGG